MPAAGTTTGSNTTTAGILVPGTVKVVGNDGLTVPQYSLPVLLFYYFISSASHDTPDQVRGCRPNIKHSAPVCKNGKNRFEDDRFEDVLEDHHPNTVRVNKYLYSFLPISMLFVLINSHKK